MAENIEEGDAVFGSGGEEAKAVVVVVGGGVAGLQTARALIRLGVAVVVLEEAPTVGGCWRESYQGSRLQGGGPSGHLISV